MMNLAHEELYRNAPRRLRLIFDLRKSEAVEALRWWPMVWCGEVVAEELDEAHVVLALATGGASQRAER